MCIGLVVRVFTNGPIPGRVLRKTQNMVLDTSLLKTLHYKVKWSYPGKGVVTSLHFCVVAIEKEVFGSHSTVVTDISFTLYIYIERERKREREREGESKGSTISQGSTSLLFFYYFTTKFNYYIFQLDE